MNLRTLAERDLSVVENDWEPVSLIDPEGEIIDKNANDPTKDLLGGISFRPQIETPETGADKIVDVIMVTLRISSLSRVPKPTETWGIRISPRPGAAVQTYTITPTHAPEINNSIGFINLFPQDADQSE